MEISFTQYNKDIRSFIKDFVKRYKLKKQSESEKKVDINMRLVSRRDDADIQVLSAENKPIKDAAEYARWLLKLYYSCHFDEYCVDELFICECEQ
ncbi:MAG: hypothetical protein LUD27_02680 [Clostridia bacterium]|nr:hypothetical protein [Clostridia bacterium]